MTTRNEKKLTAHMTHLLGIVLASGGYHDILLHSGKVTASHPIRLVDMSRSAALGYTRPEVVRGVCKHYVTAKGCLAYNAATQDS